MNPASTQPRCKGYEHPNCNVCGRLLRGVEDAFRRVPGVIDAVSGYTGGRTENPTYRQVCGHGTGHAEAVEVTFDPEKVGYDSLLDVFWQIHDPTHSIGKGPTSGINTARRSSRTASSKNARRARRAIASSKNILGQSSRKFSPRLVFGRLKEYHQRYFEKNGGACHIVPGAR